MNVMTEPTYVVDLNDVMDGDLLLISPRHTLEGGHDLHPVDRFGMGADPVLLDGTQVTIYSGDEQMTWQAQVVKGLADDHYAVRPDWDSGQTYREGSQARAARLDESDRLSLHGMDPEDVLRAMLGTRRLDG